MWWAISVYSFYLFELSAAQPDVEIVGPSFVKTMKLTFGAFRSWFEHYTQQFYPLPALII